MLGSGHPQSSRKNHLPTHGSSFRQQLMKWLITESLCDGENNTISCRTVEALKTAIDAAYHAHGYPWASDSSIAPLTPSTPSYVACTSYCLVRMSFRLRSLRPSLDDLRERTQLKKTKNTLFTFVKNLFLISLFDFARFIFSHEDTRQGTSKNK